MGSVRSFVAIHWRNTVYSNVWISICAFVWILQSEAVLCASTDFYLPLFASFSTLFLYNFQRILKLKHRLKKTKSNRNHWISNHATFLWIWTIIGFLGVVFTSVSLFWTDIFLLVIPTAISFLYVMRIFRVKGNLVTGRQIPHAKIWMIALSWAALGALIPLNHFGSLEDAFSTTSLMWFLEKLFFFVAITIPFDLRDLQFDPTHMRTIPQIAGEKRSLKIGQLLMLLSTICALALYLIDFYSLNILLALTAANFITALLIGKTNAKRDELWYGGVLDSTIFLQSAAVLMVT
jgi:hypothetical protein